MNQLLKNMKSSSFWFWKVEDLKAKLEEVAAKQDEVDGTSDLARTKADLDRIKFLYEKAMKTMQNWKRYIKKK